MVVVTVTITIYGWVWGGGRVGSAGCFANIVVLLNSHRIFANTGFSEEEIWSQRTESFPKVT